MKFKISENQALMFIIAQSFAMFIVVSGFIAKDAGRDGWISILVSFLVSSILFPIVIHLNKLYPDKTIIEYLPDIWGKVVGKIIGAIIILNFFVIPIMFFRGTTGNIKALYMNTPQVLLTILSASLAAYAIHKGLEVLIRTTNFLLMILLLFTFFSLLALIPDVGFYRIKPILENGLMPILKGMPLIVAININTIVLVAFMLPKINLTKKTTVKFIGGFLFAGILQAIDAIYYVAFFGLKIIQNNVIHPFYNMLRYIYVGNFLSGFESLFIVVWLADTFFLFTGYMYPCISGLADLLKLKTYRPLVLPITALLIGLSILIVNPIYNIQLYFLANYTLSLSTGVLLIASFVVALIKNRKKSHKKALTKKV